MESEFNNQVVIITGGAGGIGSDCAKEFAKCGAKVAVVDCNKELGNQVVEEIKQSGGEAKLYLANILLSKEVDDAVEEIVKDFGKVDILVNLAGGSARKNRHYFYEQSDEVFQNIIAVNLFGTFYFCRKCAQYMIEAKYGKIINTSSVVGLEGHIMHSEYAAAKGGVVSMSKSMAKELGKFGINVNCVCPGMIPTKNATNGNLDYTNYLHMTPSPRDITNAIMFLASSKARFITGHDLIVDGGRNLATRGTESN
ncbi:MAG TPA: 3-oxoacyl-ACP reductase [Firmicutes bacterium]|nr:3-oxoacyl-ACP reductase [Bacillota bacterium]